ncbi:carotenoid oxygenase family protein [Candidatus Marimicrobium litorale]|uniref:Carotenoid oxygenase family protein n=1 Tax=Candidatus Marimicrobium litorale TaxID=2518991 RepID=A0ABT3T3D0_9GAMM|nr:carotenoid oxygenase family protein [Candidatus Marimicrobium litorale]MCX2976763.1 carotenoid oxygenase family protein [Candidatus Marimicrobium litorale]
MSQPMSDTNPFLNFPYGSIQMECDANDLIVEGEVPADLCGSLYRAGPNQRFSPRGDYHLFMGDGMVHAFHIENGKVDYNNRWVRTAKWKHEDRAGETLINPMNPFDCDPQYSDFVFTDKDGTANTATVWHGGRLLVMEEGHPPYEVDPRTLESIGSWNFRGKLNTAMTAHPKIDPDTGEMVFFAYMASGPFSSDVMLHKVNKDGILTDSIHIPTPYSAMVHDFVITENYIIVPIMPITGSLERAMEGGPPFAWEPEKGVHLGIIPRDSSSPEDVRWVEMDLCFTFHFMNGFDKDGVITIDGCQFEQAPLFPTPDGESTGKAQPFLTRWTIDMTKSDARATFEQIDEFESEFPQCDPRHASKAYRHGWYASTDGSNVSELDESLRFYNVLGHFDHEGTAQDRFNCGQSVVSEPIFVPAPGSDEEGKGYLLSVVTSFETRTSSLYIFNALKLADGPVAKVHLSHRIPAGFHGSWRQG